jgi:hypothetical protein
MKESLRKWRFEIVLGTALAAGLFLLFERMSIRTAFRNGLRGLGSAGEQLLVRSADLVVPHTASDAIGLVLIIGVLLLARWRLRWRLQHSPSLTARQCPSCGETLHRIHRKPLDRVINWAIAPVHRYVCGNPDCRWKGLRVDTVSSYARPSQSS